MSLFVKLQVACGLAVLCIATSATVQAIEASADGTVDAESHSQGDAVINLGVSSGGLRRQVPGRWAMLSVGGSNPTEQDRGETMAVIVDHESNVQYARRMWLPARARRVAQLPIEIPTTIPFDQNLIDYSSMQIHHAAGGAEQFQKDAVGMPSTPRTLLVSKERSRAAIVLDLTTAGDAISEEQNQDIADAVNAGRDVEMRSSGGEGLIHIPDHFLPASPVGLDAVDQIVIASDRILNDTLSLSRLQSWLQAGGQLWLMADRVSPEAARMLLGDAMCYSVVDQVALNRIEYAMVDPSIGGADRILEEWSSERPVDFLRVIAEPDSVLCTIDGWPAAFRKRVGRGSVFVTTVGARGWVRENMPLQTYVKFASQFFVGREVAPQPLAELTAFVDDEIGYSIPQRYLIAILLGLHLLVMILAGLWLARRQSLQYLAIVVPVASLIAGGAFIVIGRQQTSSVPSTVAISQIIRNLPNNPVVNLQSVAAVYSQTERPLNISSSPDSTTLLRDPGASGEIRRLQWDDSGRSQWLFVNQPPGVLQHLQTHSAIELSPPWLVQATFTEKGFQGRVVGLPADRSEDAVVIAAPAPSLAVEFEPGERNTLTSNRDGVLSPGQFIRSAIVSDMQRERQELIRKLLDSDKPPFGSDPILLVWTDPVDSGAHFDQDLDRRGSALASVPIDITPPTSGTRFHVPATFVRIQPYAGTRGMTAIFNAQTGQWLELSQPRETEIQCSIPRNLLPCTVDHASVTIKISAPSRTLTVQSLVDGEFHPVYREQDPSGLIRFDIRDPQALTLNGQGGLVLSLDVSESEQERARSQEEAADVPAASDPSRSTWKIDYVHVAFDATMQ